MAEEPRRQLAAVMFTDMAGYTALMQRDEAGALASRRRHRSAVESIVPRHGGKLLQYFGDGSLCTFTSSVNAVGAALEIQRQLEGKPALRIGLHVGEIAYDEQGAYGDAINVAARLESICAPGEVVISAKVYDDIRAQARFKITANGTVQLKNVADDVPIFTVSLDGAPRITASVARDRAEEPATYGAPSLPNAVAKRLEELARRPVHPTTGIGALPDRVPLVGREAEVDRLRAMVEAAEDGTGSTVFFRGPRGVGKTRLSREVAEHARSRSWLVLAGRAHPSERLVPYAPFWDAMMPLLGGLAVTDLARLTPGDDAALCSLFPALGRPSVRADEGHGLPGEVQTRLHWLFTSMLARLASNRPLLLILEDLDFADSSSLELLQFVGRQIRHQRILLVAEYAGTDEARRASLLRIEHSLVSSGVGSVLDLAPLTPDDALRFVRDVLDLESPDVDALAEVVYTWSRGNPFLMRGTLRGLIDGGALKRTEAGWVVVDLASIELPRSVRDAVLVWLGQLGEAAHGLARSMAIVDRALSYELIRFISDAPDRTVAEALDELVRHQVLVESDTRWTLTYTFRHPLIRETLRAELPLAARREEHARIATALERFYGDAAEEHADELAYHFGQAHPSLAGARAIRYLTVAGEAALARHANREAGEYLQEALDRIEAAQPGEESAGIEAVVPKNRVMTQLARAHRRLGRAEASVALWRRLLVAAERIDDTRKRGRLQREIGLAYMAGGALEEAIEAFTYAAELGARCRDGATVVRSQLAASLCHQAIGQPETAAALVEHSLQLATATGDPGVLGRVHSAFLRLHIWTGRLDDVRQHAERALALARESGDRGVEFWSRWAMGAMEGLVGNTVEMDRHIAKARLLAEELGSPFAHLETSELAVELAYARGEWNEGLDIGVEAIELARATDQRSVLPRLLVWVSLIHLGRGELERADDLTREAWEVSGAALAEEPNQVLDLHSVVPAHIGRASLHLARGAWGDAIRTAEQGLAIADRSGYVVWAIHHVLPIIAEACIHARDLRRAAEVGRRMRREAEGMGHRLGLVWADACDAILTWLDGDAARGVVSLRRGVEQLESIPLTYEAARLRRQLAGRLEEVGDHEAAIAELLCCRSVCSRLEARTELQRIDEHLARLGSEPPMHAEV